jgi:hypothetical protein
MFHDLRGAMMPRWLTMSLRISALLLPLLGDVTPSLAQMAAPPPPPVEAAPGPPPPGVAGAYWAWRPGFWRWNGRRYIWIPGHYVHAPRAQAVWVPGEWVFVRGRYVWHGGHWRR